MGTHMASHRTPAMIHLEVAVRWLRRNDRLRRQPDTCYEIAIAQPIKPEAVLAYAAALDHW
jgi:hypothetical protein